MASGTPGPGEQPSGKMAEGILGKSRLRHRTRAPLGDPQRAPLRDPLRLLKGSFKGSSKSLQRLL